MTSTLTHRQDINPEDIAIDNDESEATKKRALNGDVGEAEGVTVTEVKRVPGGNKRKNKTEPDPFEQARKAIEQQLPSNNDEAQVRKKANAQSGKDDREAIRKAERTSLKQPISPLEKEACTKAVPSRDAYAAAGGDAARKKALQQAAAVAETLRITSLWDKTGPLGRYGYFWPHYDAMQRDETLVKIDFIIDYINNMLLIADTPTSLERCKVAFRVCKPSEEYTDATLQYKYSDARESDDNDENFRINPNTIPCDMKPYKFRRNIFDEARDPNSPDAAPIVERHPLLNTIGEVVNLLQTSSDTTGAKKRKDAAIAALQAKKRALAAAAEASATKKRKTSKADDGSRNTTDSNDGDEDDDKESDVVDHDSDAAIVKALTEKKDVTAMPAEDISRLIGAPRSLYMPMYTTKYERDHPHFMITMHQRLLIGVLNGLPMKHTSEKLREEVSLRAAACRVFGLDENKPSTWSIRYIEKMAAVMAGYVTALIYRIKRKEDELTYVYGAERAVELRDAVYFKRLRRIFHQLNQLTQYVLAEAGAFQYGLEPAVPDKLSILAMSAVSPYLNDPIHAAKMNPLTKYVRRLLEKCLKNGYRRSNGVVFKEVIANGYRTNAFIEYMDIKSFCWDVPNMYEDPETFNVATASSNFCDAAAHLLTNLAVPEFFPEVKRQQFVWSFKNGIYDGARDEFWPYDKADDPDELRAKPDPPHRRAESSARYIDVDFDYKRLMSKEARENPARIMPSEVQKIFDDQKLSPEVQEWAWAFIGRLFFPQRMFDNWQIVFWIKGVAGVGKSTLSHAIKAAYEPRDIGIMQNNIEPQFGLEPFIDKFLLIAPDVKGNFTLDSAVFQTMASADEMSISRKNHVARTVPAFLIPQLYLCNVFPRWVDASGSIQRRIMALLLDVPIAEGVKDTSLEERMVKKVDQIIVCACRFYKQKLVTVGTKDIWNCVPQDFKIARDQVARQTADMVPFFQQYLIVTENAEDFVEVRDLEVLFKREGAIGQNDSVRGGGIFSIKVEGQIGSFQQGLQVSLNKTLNRKVIHGCRMNVDAARQKRGDFNWKPEFSKFFTEEEVQVFNKKREDDKAAQEAKRQREAAERQQENQDRLKENAAERLKEDAAERLKEDEQDGQKAGINIDNDNANNKSSGAGTKRKRSSGKEITVTEVK
jgi:hypothetical protein